MLPLAVSVAQEGLVVRSSKTVKKTASQPAQAEGGGVMIRLMLSLVVLGAVTFAAATVRIGERTVLEHGQSLVDWDQVSKSAGEVGQLATEAVQRELEQAREREAASAPEKRPTVAARGDNAPAEVIGDEDRAALEKLLPR